jgi:hypothetical protein
MVEVVDEREDEFDLMEKWETMGEVGEGLSSSSRP